MESDTISTKHLKPLKRFYEGHHTCRQ